MLQVLKSNAGFYVGRLDEAGYPLSRESEYFALRDEAERELHLVMILETER